MKRIILIHGWEGYPEEAWFPWFKKEMEAKGFRVEVPQMPNPDEPQMSEWVPKLAEVVGEPDKDTYMIGHSLGCITILRFLEGLKEGQKVGGAVLVAGFTDNLGYKELDNYFSKPIEWEKIKTACSRFVAIHSTNDPYVPMKHGEIFREKLGAKIVVEEKKGHMGGSDNLKDLQSAVDAVVEVSGQ